MLLREAGRLWVILLVLRIYLHCHEVLRFHSVVFDPTRYGGHSCCLNSTDIYLLLAHNRTINNRQNANETQLTTEFYFLLPVMIYPEILRNCLLMGYATVTPLLIILYHTAAQRSCHEQSALSPRYALVLLVCSHSKRYTV